MSTLTVLMPVRDGAATLAEALASLRAQTLEGFEIVIVDDGSTDATREILHRFSQEAPRVRVLPSQAHGIVHALNRGLDEVRTPYVARMDADDIAHPDRLAEQVALLEAQPDVALCGTGVEVFATPGPAGEGMLRYGDWLNEIRTPQDITREIFIECPLAHPTFCFRTDVVRELGGYRAGEFPEDYDLVLRLYEWDRRLAVVPRPLLRWRDSATRHSRTHAAYARRAFLRLKGQYLASTLLAERHVIVWGAGQVGRYLSRELLRQGVTLEAFVDIDPRKWGRLVRDRLVHPPEWLGDPPSTALVVGAVGTLGARALIRDALFARGYRETRDFIMAA